MSGARLDLDWQVENRCETVSVQVLTIAEQSQFVRPLTRTRRPVRCPECASIIYSRRHRLCGVCNHPLPEHLLFSFNEAQRVESLLDRERQRHRKWMELRSR